ncbi:MAG TPA: peptidyl-tRNA hydrolase [Candidatus Poseidoniales archaeon]|jgi:PTH2 family peptidyl-tRNA hydrolase|nr:MAG: aminoacyl-tRNA hydrolase [Euryarchaeota archaeon]HIF46018.1 peptidyl-tRNA hydrolase [Candidatus Poseidoniales archaeon]HIL65872.1 peptidyl-tRNA hydrolase [Candidatus Poseidoniales archaeon]
MVLVTRADLKLSKGKLAAQCAHAAVDCALAAKRSAGRLYERWKAGGARKIVLMCADEDELKDLNNKAKKANLVTSLIRDAGHTEIPAGTITVLGIGPSPRRAVDALTGELKLVK